MNKSKLFPKLFLIIIIFVISGIGVREICLSADLLWRLTHDDQDYLIIAEVTELDEGNLTISTVDVISGDFNREAIKLKADFRYQHLKSEPGLGDYCLLSLDKQFFSYKIKWGAYKITKTNKSNNRWKVVKRDLSDSVKGELAALEYYINTGQRDFSFEYDKQGRRVTVYSGEKKIYPVNSGKITNYDILKELIKGKKSSQIQLIQLYESLKPSTPKEAVELCARGVKSRNGALQFAAMSPELKRATYTRFKLNYWTTGMSSPWIDKFTIEGVQEERKERTFTVGFALTTSAGEAGDFSVQVKVKEFNTNWFISEIEGSNNLLFITK